MVDNLETGKRTLKLRYDICNFCGQCHLYYTTRDGVDYTTEYDLASLDRSTMVVTVEKELAICELCGGAPGEVMLAQGGELAGSGISTHGPLKLFADYIAVSTGAQVYVLGFQPERIGFGESMSSVVKGSVARMAEMLMKSRGIEDFFHEVQRIL